MLAMLEWASDRPGALAQDREPRGDKGGGRTAREARRDRDLARDWDV
jgi:hypothetical protein